MGWLYIFLAGLSEIAWAFGLKYSHGFTKLGPSIFTLVLIIVSFVLFAKSLKSIPIGTAYAVFTGIGAAGTVIIGMLFLDEKGGFLKILFLLLLLGGILGLKMTTSDDETNVEGEN